MSGPRLRVVVVGAGVIGLSTAAAAARLGARVEVIDREYPGSGSSGLSLGVYNRQTPQVHELELRIRSIDVLDRLHADAGLPLDRCGYVRLARTDQDFELLRRTVAAQRRLGYTGSILLDRDELQARVPDLRCSDLVGGLYGPSDGTFDGHLVCQAYQLAAEELGATVRVRCALERADVDSEEIVLHTSQGTIACDRVVNAAGAWAPQVARILGVRCDLIAQRHAVCVGRIARPPSVPLPIVNEYMPGSGAAALVLRPEGAGRLLAMLHSHEALREGVAADPDRYARSVGLEYVEQVAERLLERLPGLADDISIDAGWAGLYPISPDGRFLIGPHANDRRMVAAAGVGGVGVTVSPAVGRLAAEWAVRGRGESVAFADSLLPDR